MSVRERTRQKTNTAHINKLLTDPVYLQLMNVLSREELTFQELSEMLKRDEAAMSDDLNVLVQSGMARRHFHQHKVTYTVAEPELSQTAHILYELWMERMRSLPRV